MLTFHAACFICSGTSLQIANKVTDVIAEDHQVGDAVSHDVVSWIVAALTFLALAGGHAAVSCPRGPTVTAPSVLAR